MLHEPAASCGEDHASDYKSIIGARMFWAYAIFYAGFIAINVIDPLLMEKIIFMGLNVAVVYGMGLIIVALILAVIYDRMCAARELKLADSKT
ncbi:MAG: DUF485 domain-containing protein [Candidatus Riflebacteria bacterium]|nr:DUF485 domain-containing protein [Candidatus Riflebacteria bacterium]